MIRRQIGLFAALLIVLLIIFFPLSLALSWFGLTAQGLSARAAYGSVWSGSLVDARIGQIAVGDVSVGLKPMALLSGQASMDMQSPLGRGVFSSAKNGFSVENATITVRTGGVFAPIPLDSLDLTDVTVRFVAGKCDRAQGRVRAIFSGEVAGLLLAQGLSGAVRCERGVLLLPLVSQSAMERMDLFLQGDGEYRAEFFVRSTDPALAEKLSTSGFAPSAGGFVLRLAGKL